MATSLRIDLTSLNCGTRYSEYLDRSENDSRAFLTSIGWESTSKSCVFQLSSRPSSCVIEISATSRPSLRKYWNAASSARLAETSFVKSNGLSCSRSEAIDCGPLLPEWPAHFITRSQSLVEKPPGLASGLVATDSSPATISANRSWKRPTES